jgi:hypothetical protein
LDIRPTPSATCPRESVLPIRLRPDFSVVFEGYAGGAEHLLAPDSPGIALSGPEFSAPVDWAGEGEVLASEEVVEIHRATAV